MAGGSRLSLPGFAMPCSLSSGDFVFFALEFGPSASHHAGE